VGKHASAGGGLGNSWGQRWSPGVGQHGRGGGGQHPDRQILTLIWMAIKKCVEVRLGADQ
jgi:hypothetical protein